MSKEITIKDSTTGDLAKVTARGQLVTSPLEFSTPCSQNITCSNTAFNFAAPQSGKIFVITDVIVSSGSGASQTIEIFEADSTTSITVVTQIFELVLSAKTVVPLGGLNWLLTEGKWLNAKSDGTTAMVTIAGYFASA